MIFQFHKSGGLPASKTNSGNKNTQFALGNTLAEFLPFPLSVDTADMYIHDMFYFCNIPLSLYDIYIYIHIYICMFTPTKMKKNHGL